jgi:predicted metal-dependent enzyme (double-stranded beta helix superfamily)
MKGFLTGVILGVLVSTVALTAQRRAEEKVVQPELVLENQKVKVVHYLLQPGESSPIHTHSLDHLGVTLRGSTLRDVPAGGAAKDSEDKTGNVEFVPGKGQTHSFVNVGKTAFEAISIDLK